MDYLTWTNTKSARRGQIICGTSEMCSLQGNSGGKKKKKAFVGGDFQWRDLHWMFLRP